MSLCALLIASSGFVLSTPVDKAIDARNASGQSPLERQAPHSNFLQGGFVALAQFLLLPVVGFFKFGDFDSRE